MISSLQNLVDFLDQNGCIDDTFMAYCKPPELTCTYEEFIILVETIWENAGGWKSGKKYLFKPVVNFENYFVPFLVNKKKYWLRLMQGQGTAYSIYTQKEYDIVIKKMKEESGFFKKKKSKDEKEYKLRKKQIKSELSKVLEVYDEKLECEDCGDFEVLNAFQKNILTKNRS